MNAPIRDEWAQMALIDRMHTLLADDCRHAEDYARARWHIETRDKFRRQVDAAASIFCGRQVTGYTGGAA
jgi:hypothetical protein